MASYISTAVQRSIAFSLDSVVKGLYNGTKAIVTSTMVEDTMLYGVALETSILKMLHLPTLTRFRALPPQEALQAIDAQIIHFTFLFLWLPFLFPFMMWEERHYIRNHQEKRLSLAGRLTIRWTRKNLHLAWFLMFFRMLAASILYAWVGDQQRAADDEGYFPYLITISIKILCMLGLL